MHIDLNDAGSLALITAQQADASVRAIPDNIIGLAFRAAIGTDLWPPAAFFEFARANQNVPIRELVDQPSSTCRAIRRIEPDLQDRLLTRTSAFHEKYADYDFGPDPYTHLAQKMALAAAEPRIEPVVATVATWREFAQSADLVADRMVARADCYPEDITILGDIAYVGWGT